MAEKFDGLTIFIPIVKLISININFPDTMQNGTLLNHRKLKFLKNPTELLYAELNEVKSESATVEELHVKHKIVCPLTKEPC